MNKSQVFKQAHAMTKNTLKDGDNYQATFAICLKVIINSQPQKITVYSNVNKDVAMIGDYVKPNILQMIIFAVFVIIQNILDSEKALRIRYPLTFKHYDNSSFETCAYSQKMLADYNKQFNN